MVVQAEVAANNYMVSIKQKLAQDGENGKNNCIAV